MKRIRSFTVIVVLGLAVGCNDQSVRMSSQSSQTGPISKSNPSARVLTSCTPMSGSPTYAKTGTYNCHQYVKGALVMRRVNLTSGQPDAVDFSQYYTAGTIQQDDNFVRVCSSSDAMAIAHLPQSADHSTLITGSAYSYSYPGGANIYESGSPLNYGTACDYEYYASIYDVAITGPSISGSNYTFTLANRSKYSFILNEASRWSYNTQHFTFVSSTGDQLVIKPNSGFTGSSSVSAVINTTATENPTGTCALGVNGTVTATVRPANRTNSFSVSPPPPDCSGKLDGNTLLTVNTVSHGVQHTVVMDAPSWTWVKTGGNATWYGFGNTLTFTIPSGYATFHAYGSGCDLTMTFYAN